MRGHCRSLATCIVVSLSAVFSSSSLAALLLLLAACSSDRAEEDSPGRNTRATSQADRQAAVPDTVRSQPSTGQEADQLSEAERVVRQQQDAYNSHDIEAFVGTHAPNVRFYRYPDSLVLEGRAALRERFGRLFATAPSVHASTDARMAQGDIVVWQETATGMPGGKTNTAIFVWEVHGGQITRVLFIP
jgi:hypothetical protein